MVLQCIVNIRPETKVKGRMFTKYTIILYYDHALCWGFDTQQCQGHLHACCVLCSMVLHCAHASLILVLNKPKVNRSDHRSFIFI